MSSMQRLMLYVLRRLMFTIPVLLGVTLLAFAVTKLVPGDPLAAFLPENPTPEQYHTVAHEFGVDQPLYMQFSLYVGRLAQGNMGRSLRTDKPVITDLGPAAIATLELALCAFVLTLLIGIPLGIFLAVKQGRAVDHVATVLSLGGVAAPLFWTALMAQVLFYGTLHLLPLGGRIDDYVALAAPMRPYTRFMTIDAALNGSWEVFRNAVVHLILPATILAYRASALVVRLTRSAMLDVLSSQYIRTAQAIGVPRARLLLHWAFRSTLLPVLTVVGLTFGDLLQGSILVESVFNWPGLGLYTVQSILALDYPGVIASALVITFVYVFTNLVIDLLYPLVDPRVRR